MWRLMSQGIAMARTAMLGLNVAMLANPIGLIIAAVAALVVVMVLLYKHSTRMRIVFNNVWTFIKNVVIGTVRHIISHFKILFFGITSMFTAIWTSIKNSPLGKVAVFFENLFSPVVKAIRWVINAIRNFKLPAFIDKALNWLVDKSTKAAMWSADYANNSIVENKRTNGAINDMQVTAQQKGFTEWAKHPLTSGATKFVDEDAPLKRTNGPIFGENAVNITINTQGGDAESIAREVRKQLEQFEKDRRSRQGN